MSTTVMCSFDTHHWMHGRVVAERFIVSRLIKMTTREVTSKAAESIVAIQDEIVPNEIRKEGAPIVFLPGRNRRADTRSILGKSTCVK